MLTNQGSDTVSVIDTTVNLVVDFRLPSVMVPSASRLRRAKILRGVRLGSANCHGLKVFRRPAPRSMWRRWGELLHSLGLTVSGHLQSAKIPDIFAQGKQGPDYPIFTASARVVSGGSVCASVEPPLRKVELAFEVDPFQYWLPKVAAVGSLTGGVERGDTPIRQVLFVLTSCD